MGKIINIIDPSCRAYMGRMKMDDLRMDGAELVESIDIKTKNIRTKSLDISFNELLDCMKRTS